MDVGKLIRTTRINLGLTLEQLGKKVGVGKSTVRKWENGMIENMGRDKIALLADALHISPLLLLGINDTECSNLKPITSNLIQIPVYGKISCGTGGFNEDYIEGYFSIPENMINKSKEYFGMYADGDSMINENINPGDLIIFEKSQFLNNNEVGCFCIDENFATCKIFQKTSDMIYLYPANTNYQPIPITVDNTMFHIIGKLAFVVNNRLKEE